MILTRNNHQRYLSPLESNHQEREEMSGYLKSEGLPWRKTNSNDQPVACEKITVSPSNDPLQRRFPHLPPFLLPPIPLSLRNLADHGDLQTDW